MEHAKLPPSSTAIRMQCPGSTLLCEKYPQDEQSEKAIEGTIAHKAIQQMFLTGEIIPEATEEMIEGAELWMDTVGWCKNDQPHVEEKVPGMHEDNWGTPDLWVYQYPINLLKVYDYKFGHRYVDIFENWQLLNYAAGIIKAGLAPKCENVELCIVQPRSYHRDGPVRKWRLSASLVMKYGEHIAENCIESLKPDAPTYTGSNCIDCSARHACTTLQKSSYSAFELKGDNTPFDLAPDALGKELAMLGSAMEVLKARVSGLQEEAMAKIRRGENVPGWRVEQGVGRERWNVPADQVVALGTMMGIDVSKLAVLTPKQAIKKGLSMDMVAQFTERPVGELKLVADDGKAARSAFGEQS